MAKGHLALGSQGAAPAATSGKSVPGVAAKAAERAEASSPTNANTSPEADHAPPRTAVADGVCVVRPSATDTTQEPPRGS